MLSFCTFGMPFFPLTFVFYARSTYTPFRLVAVIPIEAEGDEAL